MIIGLHFEIDTGKISRKSRVLKPLSLMRNSLMNAAESKFLEYLAELVAKVIFKVRSHFFLKSSCYLSFEVIKW